MARIPDEQIERIKREVSLRRLLESEGLELTRHGAAGDLAARCVFHEGDRTPSLIVTEAKGLWHCLGCGAAGDAIEWVKRRRGVGFREAAAALLEGLEAAADRRACPLAVEMTDRELGLAVVGYYHETLVSSVEARGYLRRRGLEDEETIRWHRLGYANRSLGTLVPERHWKAGAELRRRLQAVGLWRASGHEHASGSVVVPIFDEEGGLAELYARKVGERLREGTPLHLYLPGPHRGVWNREEISKHEEVVVCEGAMDALTYWRWGVRNVTWVYGVEGLTDEIVEALASGRASRVLLSYDGDAAGDRGTERHAERMRARGLECFRVPIPRGQDVNSYAVGVADPADALSELVRRAEWIGRGTRPARPAEAREVPPSLAAPPSAAPPAEAEPIAPPPIAAAVAVAPQLELVPIEVVGTDVWSWVEDRRYRAQGLEANTSYGQLKVTLLATRGAGVHVDTLDLTLARARREYAKEAAAEMGVKEELVKRDLGRLFLRLEALRDERLRAALEASAAEPQMSEERREAALALLRDPRLLERIVEDFDGCGVVGERTNKLVGYLASVSRKLDRPLAVLIQSSSAAGKSSLMEAILAFVPEEERVKYSAMTGQSLFYMSDTDLRHKVLAIVEEEGAASASYALKLLQSEGELTIASTGKDPASGRLVTHEYRVEGPVSLLLTTTAVDLDEELLNRCLVLTVDEEREQTRLIHRAQREQETLEGLWADEERGELRELHRDAQRLLRPLKVVNRYARELTFLDDKTRTRRDHVKYLALIRTIALLHQYQREVKVERRGEREKQVVEVTLSDIRIANELAHEVLGRSLDELPPQTRRLARVLSQMAREADEGEGVGRAEYRVTQREIRERTGWSAAQVKAHVGKLVELEYVIAHAGRRGQQWAYEVLYDGEGEGGERFLMGLLDVERLSGCGYDETWEGRRAEWEDRNGAREEAGRCEGGPREVRGMGPLASEIGNEIGASRDFEIEASETAHKGEGSGASSKPKMRRSRTRPGRAAGEVA